MSCRPPPLQDRVAMGQPLCRLGLLSPTPAAWGEPAGIGAEEQAAGSWPPPGVLVRLSRAGGLAQIHSRGPDPLAGLEGGCVVSRGL